MQKRKTTRVEDRAPEDCHLTAVMSFLVTTLSERVRKFFPVGIGKTPTSREQSHISYLAQYQSASQYIGTLLVEMMIEHEHMHLSTLHGLLERSQSEFVPGFDAPPPHIDFVHTWEMSRVITFHALYKSDRGPEQLRPCRWRWKLLERCPPGDAGLRLQAVTHFRKVQSRTPMHHTARPWSTGTNSWSAWLTIH